MALLRPQLQRFLLTELHCSSTLKKTSRFRNNLPTRAKSLCCSAIAIDSPSSLGTDVAGIRWGSTTLQGLREEMEDEIVLRSDGFDGFSFAAVFDGHGGSSSVKFLRDELYNECVKALQAGLLLNGKDVNAIKEGLQEAFANADKKLLEWLEAIGDEDESGSTATVIFLGNNILFVSHVGDSSVASQSTGKLIETRNFSDKRRMKKQLVLSRSGKAEILTGPHRPYGNNKSSLQEIRRIREAGGWIVNGRICGDISVSRAFGDIRFKTKKNEMLKKGVEERRWTDKFISRVQFSGDLVISCPDVFEVALGPDTEFVLLASDGLWDYIDSSDAVTFVRNQLRQHGDVQQACEALGQAALDRRSQDNVSIIIADLGRTDWRSLPPQQQNVVLEFGQAFATIGIVSIGIWMTSLLY